MGRNADGGYCTRLPASGVGSLFFRPGLTAFGGPAAHVAMMEQEAVRRREWLTHEDFLDLPKGHEPNPRSQLNADGYEHRIRARYRSSLRLNTAAHYSGSRTSFLPSFGIGY